MQPDACVSKGWNEQKRGSEVESGPRTGQMADRSSSIKNMRLDKEREEREEREREREREGERGGEGEKKERKRERKGEGEG